MRISAWSRLKRRYGVSGWGVIAILLAFSLAGITVLKVSGPIMRQIVPTGTSKVHWWTIRILIILPIYQVLLLGYGNAARPAALLLGQADEALAAIHAVAESVTRTHF